MSQYNSTIKIGDSKALGPILRGRGWGLQPGIAVLASAGPSAAIASPDSPIFSTLHSNYDFIWRKSSEEKK